MARLPTNPKDPFAIGMKGVSQARRQMSTDVKNMLNLDKEIPGERNFNNAESSMISGLNEVSPITQMAEGGLPEFPTPFSDDEGALPTPPDQGSQTIMAASGGDQQILPVPQPPKQAMNNIQDVFKQMNKNTQSVLGNIFPPLNQQDNTETSNRGTRSVEKGQTFSRTKEEEESKRAFNYGESPNNNDQDDINPYEPNHENKETEDEVPY